MKLSWLNTSEAHKQTKHVYDMTIWINVQSKRERELEKVDQTQTPRYVSRFEHQLYIPAFTQKDFH